MSFRCAHIADVHIRGLTRHDEITTVVDALVDDVQRRGGVDRVLVAGDTFHTKTQQITPEAIDVMHWMFRRLSTLGIVDVTLGNHDFNQTNKQRKDIITSIVNMMASDRVNIYRHSGVYKLVPGYNLCLFSIFDEHNWANVKPIDGEVNIASYHGPVNGAQMETTDWKVDTGLDVSFFKDFDFTMLGDLHMHQHLDYRDIELVIDENDLCKYPDAEIIEVIEE